ncbi:MAG: hypothetical protein ACR2MM_06265 [Flavobacteriaceae bacterium]
MSLQNENIEELFNQLRGSFDNEEPKAGHKQRFIEKLNTSKGVVTLKPQRRNWWKPISIAASVALLLSLGIGYYGNQQSVEQRVAEISPEASQTHFYFANLIEEQVKVLEEQSNPETKEVIADAMIQLQKLEENYTKLENDLLEGGDSKLILSAMITNFQTRIDLLEEVMNQINTIKNINTYDDANYTI